jgi:branched-subunit amino acid aminotransferase/4-amino-4-deoxychorismate lyase
VTEKVITLKELALAQKIMIGNSVRGDIPVQQIDSAEGLVCKPPA